MSPQEVIDLFELALRQPGWVDDKVPDQFPRAGSKNTSGNILSGMGNGEDYGDPNQGKKRGLSKSLGPEQLSVKRAKRD